MPVVKKTVALNSVVDEVVRKCWAILIQRGYDATYSMALNALIMAGWLAPTYMRNKDSNKLFDDFNNFLHDENTIKEINFEEMVIKFEDHIVPRNRQTVLPRNRQTILPKDRQTKVG